MILLVFKKYKNKKNQNLQKRKKLRDQVEKLGNIFAYKYWSLTHTIGGAILTTSKKNTENPNLNPLIHSRPPPLVLIFFLPADTGQTVPHPATTLSLFPIVISIFPSFSFNCDKPNSPLVFFYFLFLAAGLEASSSPSQLPADQRPCQLHRSFNSPSSASRRTGTRRGGRPSTATNR